MNHPLLRAGMWFLTFIELAVGHDHYTASQAIGETTALTIAALLPLALLALTWRVPAPNQLTDRM